MLALEIFPYYDFVWKFKIQSLIKWKISGRNISRTIVNITIIFSAIHIHIKAITFKNCHCCRNAPVNCLPQFFCYYFYNCCSYFSTFNFIFTFLISFIVTIYFPSNFCRLHVYFLSIYLEQTTHFAQEKSQEKKFVQFKVTRQNKLKIIFFSRRRMVSKRSRVLTCGKMKPKIALFDSLITWS